jgi:hypothetical protein
LGFEMIEKIDYVEWKGVIVIFVWVGWRVKCDLAKDFNTFIVGFCYAFLNFIWVCIPLFLLQGCHVPQQKLQLNFEVFWLSISCIIVILIIGWVLFNDVYLIHNVSFVIIVVMGI